MLAYVPGETLRERLARHAQPHFEEAGSLILSLADALHRLHQFHRLHLALHPSIVVVGKDRTHSPRATLLDLGLLAGGRHANSEDVAAVPSSYVAPELRAGDPISPSSDVYGLGLLLYEMLSSRAAFPKLLVGLADFMEDPSAGLQSPYRPDLRSLPGIAMRALARDSRQRYPDAAALFAALRRTLPPVAATPRSRWRSALEIAAFIASAALTVIALLALLNIFA